MGRAELLLVLLSIAIFGRYSLIVNDTLLESSTLILNSEYEITGISAADEIFEEAWIKSFDETTVGSVPSGLPAAFTGTVDLGPDSGESYPNYDDLDDFNGLTISDSASNGMTYQLSITVQYADDVNLNNTSSSRSYYKLMTITVTSDYLLKDITLNRLYSFYG